MCRSWGRWLPCLGSGACLVFVLYWTTCPASAQAPADKLIEKRIKFLGKMEPEAREPFVLSPNGDRLAYVTAKWDKEKKVSLMRFFCDGKPEGHYKSFTEITFSPDGKRLAYFAVIRAGGKRVLVCDGKESPSPDTRCGFAFSADSSHLAYVTRERMVRDGKPIDTVVGSTGEPVFSPNSRHLAYQGGYQPKRGIVIDGYKGPGFEDVGVPAFSPDSKRLAYAFCQGGKWGVTCGKTRRGPYDEVGKLIFSIDSQALAYRARKGTKWFMVYGKTKGPSFAEVHDPVFALRGKHFAYAATDRDSWFIIRDGKKGPGYNEIGPPVFSPDGKHLAHHATRDGKTFVVCDGRETKDYEQITWLGFSPDSKHLAFCVARVGKKLIICDGLESPEHDDLLVPERFADGLYKLRYVAIDAGKEKDTKAPWLVEVDWPVVTEWFDGFNPAKK